MGMRLPRVLLRGLRVLMRLFGQLMRAQVVALAMGRRSGSVGMGGKIVVLSSTVVWACGHRIHSSRLEMRPTRPAT